MNASRNPQPPRNPQLSRNSQPSRNPQPPRNLNIPRNPQIPRTPSNVSEEKGEIRKIDSAMKVIGVALIAVVVLLAGLIMFSGGSDNAKMTGKSDSTLSTEFSTEKQQRSESFSTENPTFSTEFSTTAVADVTENAISTTAANTAETESNIAAVTDSENRPAQLTPLQQVRELAAAAAGADGVDNAWALWLINSKNPHPADYVPALSLIGSYNGSERYIDNRAAEYALLMTMAARIDGVTLTPVSAYRSVSLQTSNFEGAYREYVAAGHSPERAFELTASEIAVPGTSEHNAGLAIDFNLIGESFESSAAFKWLSANAQEFGFILRYPSGKTDITGIMYEPWHWRFIGVYHAKAMHGSGLTLEEYIGSCRGDVSVVNAFKTKLTGQ